LKISKIKKNHHFEIFEKLKTKTIKVFEIFENGRKKSKFLNFPVIEEKSQSF